MTRGKPGSRRVRARLIWPVFAVLLSACSTFDRNTTDSPTIDPSARIAVLAGYDTWRLSGRIAIQHDDNGVTANLDWRQRGESFDIRIIAPLNGGTFALRGSDSSATLLTPQGETFSAPSAEALLAAQLGWAIPLRGVRYWIRGMPAPDTAANQQRFDEDGKFTDFEQQGWRVSMLDYFNDMDPQLPRKLFLNRANLKVRMVVRKWERD